MSVTQRVTQLCVPVGVSQWVGLNGSQRPEAIQAQEEAPEAEEQERNAPPFPFIPPSSFLPLALIC